MKKEKWRSKNFLESLKHALDGIFYAASTQTNVKIHLCITMIVLIFSLFFSLNNLEFLFLILSISFVIFAELINTAIEAAVDLSTEEYHIKAKVAKDVAAGAVVIASLNAVMVGLIIFGEKIFSKGIKAVSLSNISIIQFCITSAVCVLVLITLIKCFVNNKNIDRSDINGKKSKKEKK